MESELEETWYQSVTILGAISLRSNATKDQIWSHDGTSTQTFAARGKKPIALCFSREKVSGSTLLCVGHGFELRSQGQKKEKVLTAKEHVRTYYYIYLVNERGTERKKDESP